MNFIQINSKLDGIELGSLKDSAEFFDLMQLEFPFEGHILHNDKTYKIEVEVCGSSIGSIKTDEFGNIIPLNSDEKALELKLDKDLYLNALELELKTGIQHIDWIMKAFLIINVYYKDDFHFLVKKTFSSIKDILNFNNNELFALRSC